MEFPDEAFKDVCCIKTLYSTNEGFFKEFVGVVLEKTDSEWINKVFKKQITAEDKIRICCGEPKIWATIQDALQNICPVFRKKCAEASKSARLDGDELCRRENYKKAVMIYSQSIIRAPPSHDEGCPQGHSLALAYKARANALFALQQYQQCLADLNMALKEGFPTALKYQIYHQMGLCYKGLLELGKAQISLQVALKLIDEQILKLETTVVKHGQDGSEKKTLRCKRFAKFCCWFYRTSRQDKWCCLRCPSMSLQTLKKVGRGVICDHNNCYDNFTSKCNPFRTKTDKNKDAALKKMLDKERDEMKQAMAEIPLLEGETKPETDGGVVQYIGGALPELTGIPNDKYPTASSLLTIKQSAGAGRFAVAADKIDTGATLVVEEPQASVLIPQMFASHCLHCLVRLYTPVPCKVCSGVAFCSVRCRDLATSSYHKYECQFMGLFLGSGMSVLSLLSLRMVTQESLQFFKQLHAKVRTLRGNGDSASVGFSQRESQYMHVYNLTTHSHLRTGEDFFRRTLMAVFLVKCLAKSGFFGPRPEGNETDAFSQDEILTASLILRHLELLQFNAHEIYETRVSRKGQTRDAKSVFIAVGIYPTVALFNHECAPSVTRYFNGKHIVIKAVRPLDKNQVLSENYGPHHAKKILYDRIRELTSRYWFRCECRACVEDWPLAERLAAQHFTIKCTTPSCSGKFSPPKSAKTSDTNPICPRCLKRTNVPEVLARTSHIQILFDKALEYMEDRNCPKAVPLLTAYLDEMFHLVSPPCKQMFLAQEALRTCYAQTGNVWLMDA